MELLIMMFYPHSCYLMPLRPKYSPQNPILKHAKPTFLPQCPHAQYQIQILESCFIANIPSSASECVKVKTSYKGRNSIDKFA
jgi:hypothetical protein